MAKSIRSKWRRKCRAVKRERYGQKELERLKKTVGHMQPITDADMTEVAKVATVVDAKTVKEEVEKLGNKFVDDKGRVFNTKTMRDQNGTFPVWMSQRRRRGIKKKSKKQ